MAVNQGQSPNVPVPGSVELRTRRNKTAQAKACGYIQIGRAGIRNLKLETAFESGGN